MAYQKSRRSRAQGLCELLQACSFGCGRQWSAALQHRLDSVTPRITTRSRRPAKYSFWQARAGWRMVAGLRYSPNPLQRSRLRLPQPAPGKLRKKSSWYFGGEVYTESVRMLDARCWSIDAVALRVQCERRVPVRSWSSSQLTLFRLATFGSFGNFTEN